MSLAAKALLVAQRQLAQRRIFDEWHYATPNRAAANGVRAAAIPIENRLLLDGQSVPPASVDGGVGRSAESVRTHSPAGSLPPDGRRVVWDLSNIYTFDHEGRITAEWVRTDNQSVLQQLQAPSATT